MLVNQGHLMDEVTFFTFSRLLARIVLKDEVALKRWKRKFDIWFNSLDKDIQEKLNKAFCS
jgi:hypothetical protein